MMWLKIIGLLALVMVMILPVMAGNVTVEGNLTVTNLCTGTEDCNAASTMWIIITVWFLLLLITEIRQDIIFALVTLLTAGIAMGNAFFTTATVYGVSSFNLSLLMVVVSIYVLFIVGIQLLRVWGIRP